MATTCKWVQTPAVVKSPGRRMTMIERIRRWWFVKKHPVPCLVYVDYNPPVYPGK